MARVITNLHPTLQNKITELLALCNKNGISIKVGECVRTVAEQDALYAQGRTTSGTKVTNAKGSTYSSMHQWGIAFDFYLDMDVDGDNKSSDDAFNNSTKLFNKVGKLGQSIGLEWGGSWTSITDLPHFQLADWGSTPTKLKSQYGTPDKFKTSWIIQPTKTVSKTSTKGDIKWLQDKLNVALKILGSKTVLTIDGGYGTNTKNAVLELWKLLGWNKDGDSDGTKAGSKTIVKLSTY